MAQRLCTSRLFLNDKQIRNTYLSNSKWYYWYLILQKPFLNTFFILFKLGSSNGDCWPLFCTITRDQKGRFCSCWKHSLSLSIFFCKANTSILVMGGCLMLSAPVIKGHLMFSLFFWCICFPPKYTDTHTLPHLAVPHPSSDLSYFLGICCVFCHFPNNLIAHCFICKHHNVVLWMLLAPNLSFLFVKTAWLVRCNSLLLLTALSPPTTFTCLHTPHLLIPYQSPIHQTKRGAGASMGGVMGLSFHATSNADIHISHLAPTLRTTLRESVLHMLPTSTLVWAKKPLRCTCV